MLEWRPLINKLMKKFLLIAAFGILLLPACTWFGGKDGSKQLDPEQAAKKLAELQVKVEHIKNPAAPMVVVPAKTADAVKPAELKKVEEISKPVEKPKIEDSNFIKLSDVPANGSTINKLPLILTGKVSTNVTKIIVTATSESGKYNDVYQLNDFKAGSSDFTYRASTDWENLWNGTNTYQLKAYFKDGTSKDVKIKITFKG